MKKILLMLTCALAATFVPMIGQEAKIMIVERSDSQKLAKSYHEYTDALARWEAVKIEVAKQYTNENGKPIAGWEKIQFSADFRAIVPETSQYSNHGCYWGSNLTNTINTTSTFPASSMPTSGITSHNDIAYDLDALASLGVDQTLITKEKH